MISRAWMSALYPGGVFRNLPCACIPQTGVFFFVSSPFLLGQGPPNLPSLPLPRAGYTKDRSELAFNAKLAFSILHKVHGTMATCLGRNHNSPQAASGFSGP